MKEKTQTKIVLAFTVFFLTVSCVTYHSKPISPAQTALTFESRTLDNPDLRRFIESNFNHATKPWPPNLWDFTTLTLTAFYYSPDLDVARAKWGAARAGVITAGQRPNPSATFVPEVATHSPAGVSPWILSLALDIPIETAGKRGYRIAQAEHLSKAAHLNIATVAWQVRGRLRARLLDLYAAEQTERLLKGQVAVQEELVQLLEKRLVHGLIPRPDLTQARISFDQTSLSLREAQKESAQNRVRAAEALGLAVNALKKVDIAFDFLKEFPKELPSQDIQRQALLNRPDILSALSEYEAAQSALQLQIAKQYPNVTIGPGYQYDQGENKWSIGISLSLPILNQNQGPIAEAEARRREISSRFFALQSSVIGEIDLVRVGYAKALENLKAAEDLLALQKQQEQSVRARLESGQTDRLALVSAQLEVSAMALSRLKALYNAQQALGLLENALWRPWGPSEGSLVNPPENNPRGEEGKAE
jgi:cobalt-zinc-cadmium efflux system outer membrane protein